MRWHGYLVSDFLSRVLARAFIFWNDHHQWQTIAEDFQTPYMIFIHDFKLIFFRQTSPVHSPAWIGPPGNKKNIPRNRSWEFLKKFLGTLQKVPGNKNLFTWLQTAKRSDSQELFMEPDIFTWHKTQVSAMFPRTFPGIETASSWDLCSACQGPGEGGWKLPGGPLDNQRSLDD